MLNIDFKPTFTRTVRVSIPSGRSFVEQDFLATFEAIDIAEIEQFDTDSAEGARKFLERVFVGAEDVVDGNGNAVEFTLEMRDRLVGKAWARQGLIEAYLKGLRKAAEGN